MPCSTPMRTEVLRDARDFVRSWDAIQALRRELGVEDDVLLNPLHFLSATDQARRSCSVACWRGDCLIGVVYATEHYLRGLRTGYVIGGDFVGRGLTLSQPEDADEVVRLAIETLAASGVHALHLRMMNARPEHRAPVAVKGFGLRTLDALVPGDRMELPPTFDGWLATLGKHTRRNVRYYSRRAAAAGIQFVPELTPDEYRIGVERLNSRTAFHAQPMRLARDERLLDLHGGGLRCGLRAADGQLVAVVSGFSQGSRFHLLTQLNAVHLEHLSLSLVLRGYVVQHLIQAGHNSLQFMGGASLSFGRFCVAQNYRSVFVDKSWGITAALKFLTSRGVWLLTRLRVPAPGVLEALSNGYLDQPALVARTVLAPAAIVSQALASQALASKAATTPATPTAPAQLDTASPPYAKPFPPQSAAPAESPRTAVWVQRHTFTRTSLLDRT